MQKIKFSKELLQVLVCPADKGKLKLLDSKNVLECTTCNRKYHIKNGIPIMLLDRILKNF